MPPAPTKWLYVTLTEDDATGRLAFVPGETSASLVLRSIAAGELAPYVPFAYKAAVSVDGGANFFNDATHTFNEYPNRGDVSLRITKRPARAYVHIFSNGGAAIEKRYAEPRQTLCLDGLDAGSSAASGLTRGHIEKVAKGAVKPADAVYYRTSPDGAFVLLTSGTGAAFAGFPWNGDVFVVEAQGQVAASGSAGSAANSSLAAAAEGIQKALGMADALTRQKRYAAAAKVLDQLLDALGPANHTTEAALAVWHQLSLVHCEAGARIPAKACVALRKCLQISRNMSGLEARKAVVQYASNLAKELFLDKQYRESANMYQEVFDAARGDVSLSTEIARELRVRMGGALFMGGAKQQGMAMVQDAVAGDTSNDLGIYWMSKFYAEMDHDRDALQWAATLLMKDSANEMYRQHFGELVQGIPDTIEILKERIITGRTPKHAEVWAFLGTVLNEAGLLTLSRQFYEVALDIDPVSASYALNYAHVLEHAHKLHEALRYMHDYLIKRGDVRLGVNKAFGPTPAAVAELIGTVYAARFPTMAFRLLPPGSAAPAFSHISDAPKPPSATATADAAAATAAAGDSGSPAMSRKNTGEVNHVQCFSTALDESGAAPVIPGCVPQGGSDGGSLKDERPEKNALFREDDLYTAGMYFTAVKMLFVLGALDKLPQLIATVNPLRMHQQFHLTKMKNEHSYFATVSLALQWLTAPDLPTVMPLAAAATSPDALGEFLADPARCIYYVGDSHSLTPSWHVVTVQGRRRLLVNRLVTGLKCWHLRPEGNFYPKKQFEAVTATLPAGADCVFNFGEIDCRESVLRCVERGVYEDIDASLRVLAGFYIGALLDVKRARRLGRIVVLGPLPVIDQTRHLVAACNRVFAEAFRKSPEMASNKIVFVDVCDRLLCAPEEDPKGGRHDLAMQSGEMRVLRSEYHFDRTHMHPLFVSRVLEPALNEALA